MVFTGVPTNLAYDFAAEVGPVARAYVLDNAPKAALVAAARGFAFAHHLGQGAVSGLITTAIMGAWRATSRTGPANLRGSNFTHTRLPPRVKPRPMERAPKRLQLEPGSASSSRGVQKNGMRAENSASGLEIVERPMRLQKTQKGDSPNSAWSALKDLMTGKKVLKNTFSFKMSSIRDKRGLMAIPLRHDADVAFTDANWATGAQVMNAVAATDGYNAYRTMLETPTQTALTAKPLKDVSNCIIPRLNLPSLEQTSWDLNAMKILPQDNLMGRIGSADTSRNRMVQPVYQLGGTYVPYVNNATANAYANGYPAARDSYARQQMVVANANDPAPATEYTMPRFKTQLGSGSLKMRMCNQGTNKTTVEFVVVKVVNPYVGQYNPVTPSVSGGVNCNMTNTWLNLYNTVGYESAKKVQANLSYKMGDVQPTQEVLQLDPISNPYKTWLPSSCFKSKYNNTDEFATTSFGGEGGLYNVGGTLENNPLAITAANDPLPNDEIPFDGTGGAGQKTPYREVNRGHCTIQGAAERTITIPLPGSNYDASKLESLGQNLTATDTIDDATPVLMSDESYIVLVSINGSLQDILEPQLDADGSSTGNVKVIGKAYTSSIVDFYCQYTETVYPSHCDYSAITPVAYNLGTARGNQVVASDAAYPGKVMPMADAIPVTQAGVLRTGAKDRAGDNAGSV